MSIIKVRTTGNFQLTMRKLTAYKVFDPMPIFEYYGELGCQELAQVTPKDTGLTSASWEYSISKTAFGYSIVWSNTNTSNGIPIVILLMFGHGLHQGGYVTGYDFVTPVLDNIVRRINEAIVRALRR